MGMGLETGQEGGGEAGGGERGGWTSGHWGSTGLPARQPLYLWAVEGALFLGEWGGSQRP